MFADYLITTAQPWHIQSTNNERSFRADCVDMTLPSSRHHERGPTLATRASVGPGVATGG